MNQPPPPSITVPPASAPGLPPTAVEERLGILDGDRACARCCFNLSGQQIVREPHYRMLMVRCPECGTVASIQEYPLLGRWANRWAFLVAGLWLLALLGAACATAGVIAGFASGVAGAFIQPFAGHIGLIYLQSLPTNEVVAAGTIDPAQYLYQDVPPTWWETQDQGALFRQAGGWFGGGINWRAAGYWLMMATVLVVMGIGWAVIVPHARWWKFLGVMVLVGLLALCFMGLSWDNSGFYSRFAISRAQEYLWWRVAPLTLPVAAIALLAGMLVGRRVARWLIRLLLPPRLRVPLAILWTTDGLPPPKPDSAWLNGRSRGV